MLSPILEVVIVVVIASFVCTLVELATRYDGGLLD
jgi:hypothetical protein